MDQPTGPPFTTGPLLDVGLLSPVRAGTRVEALSGDRAWLQAMLDVEVALVRAQAELGTVPAVVAEVVASVADADAIDLVALAVSARGAANPVVAVVERLTALVQAVDADAAEYVHRGATSQDILDTGAMLVAARCVEVVLADLDRVAVAVAGLARTHRDTSMAGRTLGVHAVPVTFGLKAATWLDAVGQARSGLRRVLTSGLPVQLGGAAGTMAGYLEFADDTPDRYAERLLDAFAAGLGRPAPTLPWHTVRIPVLDLAAALVVATTTLGKIAVDVRSLTRSEVAEVAEPAAVGRGGSSAMPHKRNPVLSTLIISAAMQAPGLLATLGQSMLAEDERPAGAWHAEWQPLRESLRLAGGAAETAVELLEGLTVDVERMRRNLDLTGGLISSERLAVRLAAVVGKATAKRLVSAASAAVAASGGSLADELAAAPELAGRVDTGRLRELLDPTHYLGAAGTLVDRVLRRHDEGTG